MVYNSLKILQSATDQDEFHILLSNTIDQLIDDMETKEFGVYFKNFYGANCPQWAYCYRKSSGINTNLRLESMHKIIKYIYLDAKKTKRLDKGIYAINRYVRDKIVDRIIKNVKGKYTFYTKEIYLRHKSAMKIQFQVDQCENGTWTVSTDTTHGLSAPKSYTVSKNISDVCMLSNYVFCMQNLYP
ncbi:hypothetical protein NQ314_005218 [Rhamnusium bicolor]|uniref:Uncharacterized protein n=1 Tax=Rhamnusium bicolor TaxID=1586634 RepID=A0AAV8ZH46_9CUCU|nr:hypothetical protein NQ314_005218 [Rhamnusium bicolor]